MPLIKCRTCGQGNFASSTVCINCGAPIGSPAVDNSPDNSLILLDQLPEHPLSSSAHQEKPSSGGLEPLLSFEETPSDNATHAAHRGLPPAPVSPQIPLQHPAQNRQQPSTRTGRRRRIDGESIQNATPHEAWSIDHDPFPRQIFAGPPRTDKVHPVDINEKLPWTLPKYAPDLRGTLVHMDVQEQVADYPSLSLVIMDMLAEFVWAFTNVTRDKEKETIVMTTLRVRRSDGTIQDARLRGRLTKAYLALGDTVSLWGPTRKGVVFIHRGYNHTSRAVISTQSRDAVIPAILMLICFVLFLVSLPFLLHQFGANVLHLH